MSLLNLLTESGATKTNNSIFKEKNPIGYFTKAEFKSNLELFSSEVTTHHVVKNIEDAFGIMQAGLSFTRKPNHTLNNGRSGTWLALQAGKVKRNIFITHFGDMQRLIDDYALGRLKIEKTLEEYYVEACEE